MPTISKKRKLNIYNIFNIPNIIIIILVILLISLSTYFYFRINNKNNKNDTQQAQLQKDSNAVIEKVAMHVILPIDDIPNVATVSDPSKLQSNPFFKNAKEGDKVLIYIKSGKAILYNPHLDRIVEMAYLESDATSTDITIKKNNAK